MKKLITTIFTFLSFSIFFSQELLKIGKFEYVKTEKIYGDDKSIFLKFKENSKLAYSGLTLADTYKEHVKLSKTIIDSQKRKIYYRTIFDKSITQQKADSVDIVFRQNKNGFFVMSYSINYIDGVQEKKKIFGGNKYHKSIGSN